MKVAELQKYMAVFQNSTLHKIIVKEQKANKQKLKKRTEKEKTATMFLRLERRRASDKRLDRTKKTRNTESQKAIQSTG